MVSKWSLTSTLSPQGLSKLNSQIHYCTFSPRLPDGPASPGNPADPCIKRKQICTCMMSILGHGQQLSRNRAESISSSQRRNPCLSKCTCGQVRAAQVILPPVQAEGPSTSAHQLQIAAARRETAVMSSQYYPTNLGLPLSSTLHCWELYKHTNKGDNCSTNASVSPQISKGINSVEQSKTQSKQKFYWIRCCQNFPFKSNSPKCLWSQRIRAFQTFKNEIILSWGSLTNSHMTIWDGKHERKYF